MQPTNLLERGMISCSTSLSHCGRRLKQRPMRQSNPSHIDTCLLGKGNKVLMYFMQATEVNSLVLVIVLGRCRAELNMTWETRKENSDNSLPIHWTIPGILLAIQSFAMHIFSTWNIKKNDAIIYLFRSQTAKEVVQPLGAEAWSFCSSKHSVVIHGNLVSIKTAQFFKPIK